jgi:hypothetical protein
VAGLLNDEAIVLASLPMPDEAGAFLEALKTGRRAHTCAAMAGLSYATIRKWREASADFDELCQEAEMTGTSRIDDVGLSHVEAGTPGWAAVWKTLVQQRDPSYSDKVQSQNEDTVKVVQIVPEQPPANDVDSVEVAS